MAEAGERPKEIHRRALWVFPVSQPPLHNAVVSSQKTKGVELVTDLRAARPSSPSVGDLGDVALIPNLINPHTHLEFSDLESPVGERGSMFPDWIREVMRTRREIPDEVRIARKTTAIQRGLQECVDGGTLGIGEILTQPTDLAAYRGPPSRVVAFRELISNDPGRVKSLIDELGLHRQLCHEHGMTAGVSPHAPYTVSFELLEAACRWAGQVNAPLAFHFAESPEERELLESGQGPFEDLLRGANVWREGQFGHRQPVEYLRPLTLCARAALIHGNYLGEVERQFVADHRERISVVYCPRTHEYFGHEPYPLNDYLKQGISMAIGTDSRASSPNLSQLEELLAARRLHPEVPPDKLLEMVTTQAADAIDLSHAGSIQIGRLFDFLEIPVDAKIADPYEALFDGIARKVSGDGVTR